MASRTKLLTELSVADLWKGVKAPETVWGDLAQEPKRAVKLLLQNLMHEELTAYLRAGRYIRQHSRRGVRNGKYLRKLTTTWGPSPTWRSRAAATAASTLRCFPATSNAPLQSIT